MLTEYSDWSALLGFYNEAEARRILLRGVELSKQREEELMEQIRETQAIVSTIHGRLKVAPKVEEIPASHGGYLEQVQKTSVVEEVMKTGVQSCSFGVVELANLHVYQPYINLEYAAKLIEKAPEPNDFEGKLKYCLPVRLDPSNSRVSFDFDSSQNTYSLVSENLDLRVLGNAQGDVDSTRKFVGLIYGFGLPQMFVVQFKDLWILKNGYHRAYSLLKKGHDAIPCIIVKTDSYALTGADRLGFFPSGILLSDRSPIMSDYLSKAAVTIPRRRSRAVLTVHGGVAIVDI